MLSIETLNIHYGDAHVVRNLTLHIAKGEILALVGPTGCGKSSALRAIAGLLEPSKGEIRIDGQATTNDNFVPPEKRSAGMVFQDFALFPHLNVEENVGFRVSESSQVDLWLSNLGLKAFREAMPETLSGGQKQRVALARSLAHQPKLLLLDEPLSNLDAALKIDLRLQIRHAIKKAGVTAIWVTHDQNEAMAISDRVAVMREGRIVQVDTPEKCYEAPNSRFVAKFFGDGSFLKGIASETGTETAIGLHPFVHTNGAFPPSANSVSQVEVLIRPHDVDLIEETPGNATVQTQAYEGETRHYRVQLDSGETLEARLSHEHRIQPETRVRAVVKSRHPLVAFHLQKNQPST